MSAHTLRNGLVAAAAAVAIAVSASPAPAASGASPVTLAQAAQVEETAQVAVAQRLALGASYLSGGYALTVVDAFSEPSPVHLGWTEVRASVVVENVSDLPMPYSDASFLFDDIFPELRVIDSELVSWSIDRIRPNRGSAPGAAITHIEPGLAGRWTVGFQVPTASAAALTLEVLEQGSVVAVVDLMGEPGSIAVDAPDLETYALGNTIAWTPWLQAVPTKVGSLVCGNPAIEPVTQIIAVTLVVENVSDFDQDWPGVKAPEVAATAQWSDGSAAEFSLETHAGGEELLRRRAGDWVIMPPGETHERALVFAAPRDARFGDHDDLPSGLYLNRPDLASEIDGQMVTVPQEPLWLDLTGADSSVALEASFCDLGFQGAPVPYAYTPQPKFEVRGEGTAATAEAQDRAANALLTEALAAAGLLYDASGQSFADATADDVAGYGPGLQLVDHDATEAPTDASGVVYVDFDADNPNFVYFVTESASGTWVCAGTNAFTGVTRATAPSAAEAAPVCYPDAFSTEQTPPAEGEATEDTGETGAAEGSGEGEATETP